MKNLFKFILNFFPRPFLIRLSYTARPFLAFFLKGETYTDPIDGKSFRVFLPYGYGKQRDNVLSPSTLSLERHRLFWLYLKNETDFFTSKKKVLHFAPEQAFYKRFKKMQHLDYTTTDLNSPLADVKADICNLPFKDNSFDVYTISFGIRNVTRPQEALNEAFRVLKPGGRLMVLEFSQIPNAMMQRAYDLYSFNVIPQMGKLIANDRDSYQYLVESIRKFPDQDTFLGMVRKAGFANAAYRNLSMGIACLHSGWKI